MTEEELFARDLDKGQHSSPDEGACAMELVSYLAHEPWSDHPACASPVIAAFVRSWNDALDDSARQMLKPFVPRLVGTAARKEVEERRSWLAMDWLVRTYLPAWLDLAKLSGDSDTIRSLPEITPATTITATMPALSAAQKHAAAAWDAARAAAWDALQPTVVLLQASALTLLDRMIECRRG